MMSRTACSDPSTSTDTLIPALLESVLAAAGAGVIILLSLQHLIPATDTAILARFGTGVVTDLESNLPLLWKADPISWCVLASGGPRAALILHGAILAAGIALFRWSWRVRSHSDSAIVERVTDIMWAAAVSAAVITLSRGSLLIAPVLTYTLGVIAALKWLPTRPVIAFGLYVFSAYVLVSSYWSFSGPLLFLAVLFLCREPGNRSRVLALCAGTAVLALIAAPGKFFSGTDGYPAFASIVPNSLLSGTDPLLGPAPVFQIVDREWVRGSFGLSQCALLIAALFLIRAGSNRCGQNNLIVAAALLSGSALLSSAIFPESVSLIAPPYTVERLWPGGVFQPLDLVLLPLAALLIGCATRVRAVPFALAGLLAACALLQRNLETAQTLTNLDRKLESLTPPARQTTLALLHSPSAKLYMGLLQKAPGASFDERFAAVQALRERAAARTALHFEPLPKTVQLYASHRIERLPVVRDGNPATRWSAQTGTQTGNEWIHGNFMSVRRVQAFQLDVGVFGSDLPTALTLSLWEQCPNPGEELPPSWKSDLDLTRERLHASAEGRLYYLPSQKLSILLDEPRPVGCFTIAQTARHPHFDWSVAELRVAFAKE